ncbi:microfibril-associated glycoprotein 4-like [Anopheles ziemanni]|uniref:microfibril-associated glycoprotein 4-like n=1 Tax=Anopheles coustani TaxID=139045 RepID=UPI00265A6A80|nr:microfibril-associated glycoprotein 4-like [Anopheles coustani]XP_058177042.1 microfibril-associated glycoprotein 4-like [Anopheles ziemanni]
MDYLQYKLQEVEQTLKTTIEKVDSKFETRMNAVENSLQSTIMEIEQASKERHINLQDMLIRLEKNDKERVEKGLKTIEIKTRGGLEDLQNQLNFNMSHIRQHQIAQIKSYQETSDTELKKIDENKNTLDMLTDSVRNISIQGNFNTMLLNFMHPVSSCRQAPNVSGKYMIKIAENTKPFEVLCEQTKFEGGWTVIQQRFDGSVDFYRNWTEYRNGFGSLDGEFWLGLEYVYQMTRNRPHELLVEIKDFHGNYAYAKYEEFEIGSESESYVLNKLGTHSGTAGDSMRDNQDEKFSTFDRNNDITVGNCAEERHGAWWYYHCTFSNLNGRYQNTTDYMSAMSWYYFKNDYRGMSYSRMMIRSIVN